LRLLGGFDLRYGDCRIELPAGSQRLLAFLAIRRQPLGRLYVAGTLWIDNSEEKANACLRTTLWRLRQPGFRLVVATASHVGLDPDVRTDIAEIDNVAHRVMRCGSGDEADVELLRSAGDVLPDAYDDWLIIERERFRQVRLHALETLCHTLAADGMFQIAIEAGLAAVDGEPLRESAHRAVISAHLAEGNYYEAIRQFRIFSRFLSDELGLEPSPEMRRLVEPLRVGDARVTHAR
jgi:DNA-binding SARP family transcriptional activator